MKLTLFVLKSDRGFYKRRASWTTNIEEATIWTTKQGAASAKGSVSAPNMVIDSFEVEVPAYVADAFAVPA